MNRPTRLLPLLWFCLFLTSLLPFSAAPGHAAAVAGAARLTPRNFVPSVDARGLLTIAFDLANTGNVTATAAQITNVSLMNTGNGRLGVRQSPAALPFALGDIAPGNTIHQTVTFTGLTSGQRARFSIAFAASGLIFSSTGFFFTVPAGPTAAPISLMGMHGDSVIQLNYTAPAGAVTYYNIKRATVSGGPYTTISAPGAVTGMTYTDTSVVNGTTYYYVVSAVSANGESLPSNQATVLAGFIETNLVAVPGNGLVTLTFDPLIGAGDYNVYESTDPNAAQTTGAYTYVGRTGGATTFTQGSLTNGTTYYYFVVPVNNGGAGTQTGRVSATPTGTAS